MAQFPPLQNRGHKFLPHRTIEAVNEMKLVKRPEQHLCDTENVSTPKAAAPLFPCRDTGTLTERSALGDERRRVPWPWPPSLAEGGPSFRDKVQDAFSYTGASLRTGLHLVFSRRLTFAETILFILFPRGPATSCPWPHHHLWLGFPGACSKFTGERCSNTNLSQSSRSHGALYPCNDPTLHVGCPGERPLPSAEGKSWREVPL